MDLKEKLGVKLQTIAYIVNIYILYIYFCFESYPFKHKFDSYIPIFYIVTQYLVRNTIKYNLYLFWRFYYFFFASFVQVQVPQFYYQEII